MYNSLEYSGVYLKTSGSLWQWCRDEPALDNNNNIINFPGNNKNSISFKSKQQITGQTGNGGTKDVEITAPLKYPSNFQRALEMPLISCEKIDLQLKWSTESILVTGTAANCVPEFKITDTKLFVPVVTLSTQDNVKLFKQLESDFKRKNNWNKYRSKKINQTQNRYLDF